MTRFNRMRPRVYAAVTATGMILAASVAAAPAHAAGASHASGNDFRQTNLVSDRPTKTSAVSIPPVERNSR